jgi:hypothetical protein
VSTLEFRRGDTRPLTVTLPQDITGISLWFTAKHRLSDADDDAVLRKSTDEGSITIPVGTDGIALVDVDASDTESLTRTTRLYYDVQTLDDGGTIDTVAHGRLVIHADVTRSDEVSGS